MATFTPVDHDPFAAKPITHNGVNYTPISHDPFSVDPQPLDGAKPTPVKSPAPMSLLAQASGAMANFNRGTGIGDEIAAAGNTAANLLSGKTKLQPDIGNSLSAIGNDFKANMARQRQLEDTYTAAHPNAAAFSRGVGMAATAAVPAGRAVEAVAAAPRITNMLGGATEAALNAYGYGLADRGTAQERLHTANAAAFNPVTIGLGAAGGALAPANGFFRNKLAAGDQAAANKIPANVALLAKEGVQMTPGQIRGGIAQTAEDMATSLPFVGQAIAARRTEGIESFVRAAVNRSLTPVGETLPAHISTGSEAVKYAGDLLSKGYEEAIPTGIVRADPTFAQDAAEALQNVGTLTPGNQKRLAKILDERLSSRIPANGQIDGKLYKKIQSDLDWEVRRFSGSTDPDEQAISGAVSGIQTAMEDAAKRQDPTFAEKIAKLDRGWSEITRVETAAGAPGVVNAMFTPKGYAAAIRSGDHSVRKRGVARGTALGTDLAQAGASVLPSKVPDSGTAGRGMLAYLSTAPGAALGALTGGGVGALAGIAGTTAGLGAAARIYTPEAVAAANKALNVRLSDSAREAAVRELQALARQNPALRQYYMDTLRRAAGMAGEATVAPRGSVSVQIEGRPDLGVGVSQR